MSTTTYTRGTMAVEASSEAFYFYMALACMLIAVVGFAPTYWVRAD